MARSGISGFQLLGSTEKCKIPNIKVDTEIPMANNRHIAGHQCKIIQEGTFRS